AAKWHCHQQYIFSDTEGNPNQQNDQSRHPIFLFPAAVIQTVKKHRGSSQNSCYYRKLKTNQMSQACQCKHRKEQDGCRQKISSSFFTDTKNLPQNQRC